MKIRKSKRRNIAITSIIYIVFEVIAWFFNAFIFYDLIKFESSEEIKLLLLFSILLNTLTSNLYGLYDVYHFSNVLDEIKSIVRSFAVFGFFIYTTFYFGVIFYIPNILLIKYIIIGLCINISLRLLIRVSINEYCIRFNRKKVAIIGTHHNSSELSAALKELSWLGFEFLGVYNDDYNPSKNNEFMGTIKDAIYDAEIKNIDYIYISLEMSEVSEIDNMISKLSNATCKVIWCPRVNSKLRPESVINNIENIRGLSILESPQKSLNSILKRLMDLTICIPILIISTPIIILIAILIKTTSKGPILFLQDRYGLDGQLIKIIKFRTMSVLENDVISQAVKGDKRITSIGKFLRKSSLDELPQLLNVFLGNMSLVGPRPHAVYHNEYYRVLISGYMLRHLVKPGITGWAQVNGCRGETDTLDKMIKRIEYDIEYINNWSLWGDFKILLITIIKILDFKNVF